MVPIIHPDRPEQLLMPLLPLVVLGLRLAPISSSIDLVGRTHPT